MSPAERFAADEVEEDETMPEEADDQRTSKAINLALLGIEKKLERRQRALEKAQWAVAEQNEEIARQHAKLVELQAEEDSKRDEILEITTQRDELSRRLVKLNAVQGSESRQCGPAEADDQRDPFQVAMECLTRSYQGLQNYHDQPPAIKQLLSQFASSVLQMQANERSAQEVGQATLHQTFAAQRATQHSSAAADVAASNATAGVGANAGASDSNAEYGPIIDAAMQKKRGSEAPLTVQPPAEETTAQMPVQQPTERQQPGMQPPAVHYNIASGTATPTASENAVPVGGTYGRAPRKHEPLCRKCWAICCKCSAVASGTAGPSDNRTGADEPMGVSETALVVWQPTERRSDLLARLKNESDRKADLARKRASDGSAMRASPY